MTAIEKECGTQRHYWLTIHYIYLVYAKLVNKHVRSCVHTVQSTHLHVRAAKSTLTIWYELTVTHQSTP